MQRFLDASGLNRYTQALKNGQLIAGRAKDSSKADYAEDASTAFYASHASALGLIGVIPLSNLPNGAIDTLIKVKDKAARLKLTKEQNVLVILQTLKQKLLKQKIQDSFSVLVL